MSKDETVPETEAPVVNQFDPSEPHIPDVFANTVFAAFGASDITVTFAQQIENGAGGRIKAGVRVTMSHHGFMEAMKFLVTRYKFLDRVYKNRTPSLFTGDPVELRSAFEEMLKSYGGGE